MIDTKDIHWAAGFIEGEGCFYARDRIDKRGYRSLVCVVTAAQVQREPLERLQRLFGGCINSRTVKYKESRRPYFTWTLSSNRAVQATMTLYTLLSPRRKEQAKKLVDTWKAYKHSFGETKQWCREGLHKYAEVGTVNNHGALCCKACAEAV